MRSFEETIAEIDAAEETETIRRDLFTINEDQTDVQFNIPLILELFGEPNDERAD